MVEDGPEERLEMSAREQLRAWEGEQGGFAAGLEGDEAGCGEEEEKKGGTRRRRGWKWRWGRRGE